MRARPWGLMAVFAAAACGLTAGCNRGGPPAAAVAAPATADDLNVDVGALLYPAKPEVKPAANQVLGGDPLVMANAVAMFEERQQVASETDGLIELIAVQDPDIDPKDPNCVYHPRDKAKQVKYRQLKEGDPVKAGQVVCFLNDELVTARRDAAQETKAAAQEVEKSAIAGVELSKQKVSISKEAWKNKNGSFVDYLQDELTLTRFEENRSNARQTIAKADADFKEAEVGIRKHRLVSTVNGFVRTIAQRPGQVVKAGEKILEIQATDVIRIEGNLDVQYQSLVKRGMPVVVEPAVPSAPFKTHALHRGVVTGVAVAMAGGRPLVVSVDDNGSARVWDVTSDRVPHNLLHPVPVRAVACTPAASGKALAATGSDDGKVRVWDLTNPDQLPAEGRVFGDAHTAAIGAVAFSPDGKFLATAAGRDVFVWDVAEGKKLYALPAEHRDAVTSLQFTPQDTLVTASKDRSLKVWKLGAATGGVTKTIAPRAGVVDVLGVTSDGGRVVFDQDKNRLDLVSLADRQTVGQVQNSGTSTAFATLAVFNSDDTLLLTAGGEGELKGGLQVWTVPAAGRAAEVARLFTPGRVGVTTAALSPSKEHPFLVVGTEKGTVHLWKPPSEAARKPYPGRVVHVDSTDPRYITVRVEMDNRVLNLRDRSSANVIIVPDGK